MKHMRQGLIIFALGLLVASGASTATAQDGIVVQNVGKIVPYQPTKFEAGSTDASAQINTGDILNYHYFPGINLYSQGMYRDAKEQMDYVIARPHYIERNPKRAEILSISHFIRGNIYFRHSSGLGRLALAKGDFEDSIKWNSENHLARLELARLVATLNQQGEAIAMLSDLQKAKLKPELRQEVDADLEALKSGKFKAVKSE